MERTVDEIIQGLELCALGQLGCQMNCPYDSVHACEENLLRDAAAMLKAQGKGDDENEGCAPSPGIWEWSAGFKIVEAELQIDEKQEAKLLTRDEARALCREKIKRPICLEERVPVGRWDRGSILKWVGTDFCLETHFGNNVYYNKDNYNITWRAWTGTEPPTDAQRAAAPWERLRKHDCDKN